MAIELITCSACGTKNASHRTVCLHCGASISTPARTPMTEELAFSESLRRWTISAIDRNETSKADKYVVAAGSVLLTGSVMLNVAKKYLDKSGIKPEVSLLFRAEFSCYILHMLDRLLSIPIYASSRDRTMNYLVFYFKDAFSFVLEEMGYKQIDEAEQAKEMQIDEQSNRVTFTMDAETYMAQIDEQIKQVTLKTGEKPPERGEKVSGFLGLVVNGFTAMYNERQLEYGAFRKESWLGDVALRFARHAERVLGADNPVLVAQCGLLAPDAFHDLEPSLTSLADIDV